MISLTPTDVSVWLALAHGFLSFFSPCVLPLIPGFIGIVLGGQRRAQRLIGFFLGFSIVFSLLGGLSSFIGGFLAKYSGILEKIIGIGIIIFGIMYIAEFQLFKGTKANVWKFKNAGLVGGFVLGGAIGFVWIPCSSPILASILLIASQQSVAKGIWLLFIYSLGISVPFLTIGAGISKALTMGFGKPSWERWIKYIGGAFMIVLGLLIILGKMKV
ncbi:cytochrome c-type biogenesis protein [Fervidobacterium changbaicum]|uniref:Cytochrome c biogenesis CcdA family protein n=2 Tax=Fervidobacterium TaxID=2422 RepID=A0AAI8CK29_FERIS|nr:MULTISPECIES: cytochrome c biogenesis CcdA family protein [Fervidobacterium]AMW32845.1 cytochrome c biogenesis CcdA family protein [Fervidobacterium islandicum]QAV32886.1 cytochrome c biogenesis protein CcdA [Fervidobacterium changbaicum]SDH74748.1 cytochrome c-type biogenesis protein [Fervidobacterium changbaicum]